MNTSPERIARRDELLREARKAMEGDNLAYAEALAQEIIALVPDDALAWSVRAHLAGLIGLEDKAVAWGRKANPTVLAGFDRPENPKVQFLLADAGSGADEERYLLIKSLGYDFWSEFFHVLGGMLLAEITNRQPCVLWGSNTPYLKPGSDNSFSQFFNGIGSELLLFLRAAPEEEIFPRKWFAAGIDTPAIDQDTPPHRGGEGRMAAYWLLNRPERVVVSDYLTGVVDLVAWIPDDHPLAGQMPDALVRRLVEKYIGPNWNIRDLAAEQIGRLEGRKTVAVHIQGREDDARDQRLLDDLNAHYPAIIEPAIAKDYAVWLMTDYEPIVDEYRSRFGDAIFCLDALRTQPGDEDRRAAAGRDPQRHAEEQVADVLIAASCDRFVGNGAYDPSCMVDFLMEGDATRKHLFLPNQNRRRFLNLYKD